MNRWLLIILVVSASVMFFGITRKTNKFDKPSMIVQPSKEVSAFVPLSEATNSEGNLKLVGMAQKMREGGNSYSLKVMDTIKKTEIPLYNTIADLGSSITIPFNSWSPDYKQVFIKISSPGGENYYLFKANGEPYDDGKKYIIVGDYWGETKTTNKINKISGWAGPDLMMVYTTNKDGEHGPSYWFVTSSRKFLQVREM